MNGKHRPAQCRTALFAEDHASLKQNTRGPKSSGVLNRSALTPALPALYPKSAPADVESRSGRRLSKAPSDGTTT